MSDMLEQAIIDAEALKEAATKNAETLILEKYSDQIKEALETLLEQEAPPLEDSAVMGAEVSPTSRTKFRHGAHSVSCDLRG